MEAEHQANLLQALLYNIPDPIYFKDRDHRFVAVSMTKAKHWHTAPQDFIGKTDFDFFDEATAEQAHTDERQVMETGQPIVDKEEVITHPDGSQRWYSVTKAPYYDAEGEILGIIGISRDITDAKLAEARLRDSEEKYRGLSENLQDVIVQVSLEGVLRYVSPAIRRLTGHDPEALLGRSATDFVVEEDRADVARALKEAAEGEPTQDVEIGVLAADGRHLSLEVTTFPIIEEGEVVAFQCVLRDITERKRLEEELTRSAQQWQNTFDAIEDMVIIIDSDYRVVQANAAAKKTFPGADVVGAHCYELIHGAEAPPAECPSRQALVTRATVHAELCEEHLGGRWFDLSAYPIPRTDGTVDTLVHILRDITERKRAEEALKEERDKAQNYLDIAGTMLAVIDADEKVSMINNKGCEILGYSEEEINGQNWFDILVPERHREEVRGVFRQLLAGEVKPVEYYENPLLNKNGEERSIAFHNTVLDEGGDICAVLFSGEDITERKQAEEALRESEERYHMIADRVSDIIWIMDMNLRYTYLSPSATQGRGYSVEELMAQNIEDALTPASLDVARAAFGEELALEKMAGKDPDRSRTLELEFTCKDGSTRWGEVTVTFLHDANGQPTGILGVTRDITDRKRAEEQLRRAQKMEAVGTLAAGIAHDFNNILQALIGQAELMLVTGDFDAQTTTNLQEMISTGWRAASLVKRLLVFSRQVEPRKQSIYLAESVEDVQLILERTISKLIIIQTSVQEDLWHVEADPQQMEQALLNMGINAAEAMPDGGALKMAAENLVVDKPDAEQAAGRYVVLSVSDTGVGIEQEHLEHIFEPFYTSKERANHSGLGLAIVHGIVDSHGASIRVSSEPGVGTTFKVYLPAAEPVATVEEVTEESAVSLEPLTVLVVDDEPAVARLLCDILENSGHHTLKALDGEAGLEVFRARHEEIDVVLLDLIMPKLEGEQCLEEMLAIDPEAAVVIASGRSIDDATRKRLEPKIKDFLAKPFEVHDVLRALQKAAHGG